MAQVSTYYWENGQQVEVTATVVTANDTIWSMGYYVVNADVTISHNVTVSGDVKLILADGFTLTVDASESINDAGITVQNASTSSSANKLAIYGQTASSGIVNVLGGTYGAGIGGNNGKIGSYVTIAGGTVIATGGWRGAGIGGGSAAMGYNITISGGTVVATGGDCGCAGIGGGAGSGGSCKTIRITGGFVDANGIGNGAGIGGAWNASADDIQISGGTVFASSTYNGAGIGGGCCGGSNSATNITISGGIVDATSVNGAGIGNGNAGSASGITITGGKVTATSTNGDAIGNGYNATTNSSNITVNTEVTLKAGASSTQTAEIAHTTGSDIADSLEGLKYASAATPAVSYVDENGKTQTIYGTLVANSSEAVTWTTGYYVVGRDYDNSGVIDADDAAYAAQNGLQTNFTITGGATVSGDVKLILADGFSLTVNASATASLAGVTVQNSSLTSTANQFAVYGQSAGTGKLTATAGSNAAGIGGGNGGIGSNITIAGGTVTATAGERAAGIGGGDSASGTNIKIYDGTVIATGGANGAGIGCGSSSGTASYINISGGVVEATGTGNGAGIGGGYNTTANNITISGGVVNAKSTSNGAGIGGGCSQSASAITISGGSVTATSVYGDAIGNGKSGSGSTGIYVNTDLGLIAGASAGAAEEISNKGADVAESLTGKPYAAVTQPMEEVSFIDEDGVAQVIGGTSAGRLASTYTLVSSSAAAVTWGVAGSTTYYVVGADYNNDGVINAADAKLGQNTFTITGGVTVSGNVTLILADGFSLTVDAQETDGIAGICVQNAVNASDNQFTVCGQTAGSGSVTLLGGTHAAGIGSNNNTSGKIGSYINIAGGIVTATGKGRGAGIGGGNANGEHISITGGVVTATGGSDGTAGIGGGAGKSGKNITISGGTVNAYGIGNGAGIGGAWSGSGEDITISGGVVTASSDSNGAGIGAGTYYTNTDNLGKNITITGGIVNASSVNGAGIGGGKGGSASNVTISGDAIVTAESTNGDAIGNGNGGSESTGIHAAADFTVRGGTTAGTWTFTSGTHTLETDFATDLAGKKYASVARLVDGTKTATTYCGGTSTRVECIAEKMLFGGTLNGGNENSYTISIGGTNTQLTKSIAAGDAASKQAVTQTGDLTLIIEGGTFSQRVAGGMYTADSAASTELDGSVTLNIKGGTFNGRIYGGSNAQQDAYGTQNTIEGSVNVTVDSSSSAIYINNYLIGGSRGAYDKTNGSTSGKITGSVTVTFTGTGSNLHFADTSVVCGGCNGDFAKIKDGGKTVVSGVDGERNLVFDNFSGEFTADLRLFSTATIKNGSAVTLTNTATNLWTVETWNFEFGSSLAGLQANDFEGDTLNFDVTGLTTENSWTAASGTEKTFDDLADAAAVYFGTSAAEYDTKTSCWTGSDDDYTYKLALNDGKNAMIVTKTAKTA